MQFLTGNVSEIVSTHMDAQREFFNQYDTAQKPPQLMPVSDAASSQAKPSESLPGFDELGHIDY